MKNFFCFLIICFFINIICYNGAFGQIIIPDNIKVGLHYGSSAPKSVTIKGTDKIEIGYELEGQFISLCQLNGNEEIVLSTDSESTHKIIASIGQEQKFIYDRENETLIVRHVKDENTEKLKLLSVGKNQYRGEIHLKRYVGSDITVISVVNIEDYLLAVVPAEIGSYSPEEAIRAQAIAAKNFVLNRIGKYSKWGFDVTGTTYDQVYEPYDARKDISGVIANLKGKVLVYNDKLVESYFYSTSGGYTADVKDVWGSTNYPYLVSVEDKYESKEVYNHTWEVAFTPEQLKQSLSAKGHDIGDILDINITKTDHVGRIITLEIKGSKDTLILQKENARIGLGINGILSQWYTVTKEGESSAKLFVRNDSKNSEIDILSMKLLKADNEVVDLKSDLKNVVVKSAENEVTYPVSTSGNITMYRLNGKGWGHGVGMSQMGAVGMAKAGYKYDEILKWYYVGTEIINLNEE